LGTRCFRTKEGQQKGNEQTGDSGWKLSPPPQRRSSCAGLQFADLSYPV